MEQPCVRVAIQRANGTLTILSYFTEEHGFGGEIRWKREATPEAIEKEIAGLVEAEPWNPAISWRFVTKEELPTHREFRNAWEDRGTHVDHNMPKAVEIHLDRVREHRAPLLDKHDKDWMKAMEKGDKKESDRIATEKQRLRDLPTTLKKEFDKAKTVEELKAIFPIDNPTL
jgi:hypothetical protein